VVVTLTAIGLGERNGPSNAEIFVLAHGSFPPQANHLPSSPILADRAPASRLYHANFLLLASFYPLGLSHHQPPSAGAPAENSLERE